MTNSLQVDILQCSVIVPMRNAEKYIKATISNLLEQEDITFEIIVVNDKSTDNSEIIVNSFNDNRIVLVQGPGSGIAEALNTGYRLAKGEIIVRCDADDFLCDNYRLSRQYHWLKRHPDFDAVCGGFAGMDELGNSIGDFTFETLSKDITHELSMGSTRTHFGTYAIKSNLYKKVGGFRPYFTTAEDIDFQLRVSEHGRVMYLPEIVYIYRLHSSSITHTQAETTKLEYEKSARLFQQQRVNTGMDDIQRGNSKKIIEDKLSLPTSSIKHAEGIIIGNAWKLHANGEKLKALKLAFLGFRKNPMSISILKCILLLLLKP
jgi:glycosyltransferase involved in cell wall biosynthesis